MKSQVAGPATSPCAMQTPPKAGRSWGGPPKRPWPTCAGTAGTGRAKTPWDMTANTRNHGAARNSLARRSRFLRSPRLPVKSPRVPVTGSSSPLSWARLGKLASFCFTFSFFSGTMQENTGEVATCWKNCRRWPAGTKSCAPRRSSRILRRSGPGRQAAEGTK